MTTALTFSTTTTPAGPFGWLSRTDVDQPVVLASGWTTDPNYLLTLAGVATDLSPQQHRDAPTAAAVTAFFDGDRTGLDQVVVEQSSGPFIQHAWTVLREITPGERVSYTEFAQRAGRPAAVRAVASACASNRCALFVPCHRVLRSDGSLGGFRYGLAAKQALLDFEAAHFG